MPADSEALARGVRLKAARELKGLSQKEAAVRLGVSRVTISGWENGAVITEDRIEGICRLYGAEPAWIRYAVGIAPEGLASSGGKLQVARDRPANGDDEEEEQKGA